jgi:hypothetical protein
LLKEVADEEVKKLWRVFAALPSRQRQAVLIFSIFWSNRALTDQMPGVAIWRAKFPPAGSRSVNMTMVNVRKVRVHMGDGYVSVRMRVGFFPIPFELVPVLVVFIVPVRMVMVQDFVGMGMLMPLADMKPDSERHQRRGYPERNPRQFRPQDERQGDTEDRRNREVRAGAGATKVAKRDDKEHQAHAITREASQHRSSTLEHSGQVRPE